jgi:hypothetical protein
VLVLRHTSGSQILPWMSSKYQEIAGSKLRTSCHEWEYVLSGDSSTAFFNVELSPDSMMASDPSSGTDMPSPGHDEFIALQTWLSNQSDQSGYPDSNEDTLLEKLDIHMPPSLFNSPQSSSFPCSESSFEHESPVIEGSHVSLQLLGDEKAKNCDFFSEPPPSQRIFFRQKNACIAGLESCSTIALNTLRKLHVPRLAGQCIFQRSCELADISQPLMLDEILRMNAAAMQSINRMLECSCLEKLSQCLMTLIICDKLVSMNSRILQAEEQGGHAEKSIKKNPLATPASNIDGEMGRKGKKF